MARREQKSLENALREAGLVTEEQLGTALHESARADLPLRTVLVQKGLATEETLARAVAHHLGIPYIDLDHYYIDPEAISRIPEPLARQYLIIPLFIIEDNITISLADPFNVEGVDEVAKITQCQVNLSISTPTAITQAIIHNYRMTEHMKKVIEELTVAEPKFTASEKAEEQRYLGVIEDNPVVKLVNMIINQAIQDRASDIHIEPANENVRVRYRVDGVLSETLVIPKHLQAAVTSRIKVLSGMNIAEKRIPQDGHVELKREKTDIDLRVSTFPTIWGEKIVLRILNRAGVNLGLQELGFAPESLTIFQKILRQPHGLVLTTGPTGSGKTTTLYAALNTVNTLQRNIITLEDPVEYRLQVVNQGQVNPTAGLSFATGLRSILRQDPDIIMVGEIRDLETAQLAVQAALTGHLVFSSLHTNDAPSTATRLIDMGVEPYLVASTLICAIGQRLVRRLCPRCKETYQATSEEIMAFGLKSDKTHTFYQPKGCKYCNQTGYVGRTGLFELMTLNEDIRRLIVEKQPTSLIRQSAIRQGMKTLRETGLTNVLNGLTSVIEVLRVTVDEGLAT